MIAFSLGVHYRFDRGGQVHKIYLHFFFMGSPFLIAAYRTVGVLSIER